MSLGGCELKDVTGREEDPGSEEAMVSYEGGRSNVGERIGEAVESEAGALPDTMVGLLKVSRDEPSFTFK